jgi:hypothetical protein
MPGLAPFMALASTGGRWNLASRALAFQECRSTDFYLRWWGRSKTINLLSKIHMNMIDAPFLPT